MATETKFRYTLKNDIGFHRKIYTLKQLEESGLRNLFDLDNYEVVGVDGFTGLKDVKGTEIYGKDLIELDDKIYRILYADAMFSGYTLSDEELPLWQIAPRGVVIGNIYQDSELID